MNVSRAAAAIALAFVLGATPRQNATVGFVDLPRAVASHPLHALLAQYDREIAALQTTLSGRGLADLPAQAERGAASLRGLAASAQPHVRYVATAGENGRREPAALNEVFGAPQRAETNAYAQELARETKAAFASYAGSIAQRNARALAARAQQLHEKELTLAFDLARANAGRRLALALKLGELHLDRADRARLSSELAALNRTESSAVAALRRSDAATLSAYEERLRREGAAQIAAMAVQLHAKAAANLALRRRVLRVDPAQAAAFRSSYRSSPEATDVGTGMQNAGADIARRFAALARFDRGSLRDTLAQIRELRADRAALYRSIVAQIVREAQSLARSRGLSGVDVATPPARGRVDLTPAVREGLARF